MGCAPGRGRASPLAIVFRGCFGRACEVTGLLSRVTADVEGELALV